MVAEGWPFQFSTLHKLLKTQKPMYILHYYQGSRLCESYQFHSKALAHWKKNTLRQAGTHITGTFKIEKV